MKYEKLQDLFPYTRNEYFKKENKKTITFKTASKRIKSIGINLTKKMKDFCSKHYKTVLADFKKN